MGQSRIMCRHRRGRGVQDATDRPDTYRRHANISCSSRSPYAMTGCDIAGCSMVVTLVKAWLSGITHKRCVQP
jgi:hypothetical protein